MIFRCLWIRRWSPFLRDQYRRKHLEAVAPDRDRRRRLRAGTGMNWWVRPTTERCTHSKSKPLRRRIEAFIERYNSSPNRSHFHTVSYELRRFRQGCDQLLLSESPASQRGRRCRNDHSQADGEDPDQVQRPPSSNCEFSRFVIPQVPGSEARSTPVHGVVESFLKSKKYIVPSAVASPIFAGCVVAVYVGTGAGRFDPAQQALVFNAERDLEAASWRRGSPLLSERTEPSHGKPGRG